MCGWNILNISPSNYSLSTFKPHEFFLDFGIFVIFVLLNEHIRFGSSEFNFPITSPGVWKSLVTFISVLQHRKGLRLTRSVWFSTPVKQKFEIQSFTDLLSPSKFSKNYFYARYKTQSIKKLARYHSVSSENVILTKPLRKELGSLRVPRIPRKPVINTWRYNTAMLLSNQTLPHHQYL